MIELKENIITRNTVLLDFSKLGYHTHAQLFLKINPAEKTEVAEYLIKSSSVNSIYKTNNNWSFIIETLHKNIRDLDSFVDEVERKFKVEDKEIHYLVRNIKKETFLT